MEEYREVMPTKHRRPAMSERLAAAIEAGDLQLVHGLCTGGEADLDVDVSHPEGEGTMSRDEWKRVVNAMRSPKQGRRLWKELRRTRSSKRAVTDVIRLWVGTL